MDGDTLRVIIDTDIGGDPDDATAIALALASPEISIEGITTVYSDVDYHARRVSRLLELAGERRYPIYNGLSETLLRNRNVNWTGPSDTQGESGQGDLLDGGRQPINAGHAVEHNIKCDPEAASVVFSSGAPIVMVGLDVTRKVTVTRRECERLIASGKPANAALADVIDRWLLRIGEHTTPMHDPLAVALAIDRSLAATRRMSVKVAYDHREGTGQTIVLSDESGTVDVCMDVDAERFLDLLFERLCGKV